MVAISISVEGISGLNWTRWKRLVPEIERLGFAGVFCSDHFVTPIPITTDSLELIIALAYLADHTERVHIGSLVAPFSFRDPVMLARQAVALDDLSGGRMILGVGAGWMEREHTMFGYELGDVPTRMDRFEEGLAVLTGLIDSEEPFDFDGRFYQLRAAIQRPRPQRPGGPKILIGGNGPERTLPLVARYADIWNGTHLSPEQYRERSILLDKLIEEAGRQHDDVKRTIALPLFCARNSAEMEQRISSFRSTPGWADIPTEEVLAGCRQIFRSTISGTPADVIEQIEAYAEVGVEELMIQWFNLDDYEGLQLLAEEVLPHFMA